MDLYETKAFVLGKFWVDLISNISYTSQILCLPDVVRLFCRETNPSLSWPCNISSKSPSFFVHV